ncbi:MAG: hypothetical protein ACYTGH_15340 [Planctomycetota bacterium]|jgi:hypothetical protein
MKTDIPIVFRSGFEAGTVGLPSEAIQVFAGNDTSTAPQGNWEVFRTRLMPPHPWALPGASELSLDASGEPGLGYFDIQYMGGTVDDRFARLAPDPVRPDNQVLHYCISQANEPIANGRFKARVQAAIYENRDVTALKQTVRLRLHEDLDCLHTWERGFDWFTLQELWFEPRWTGEGHAFRISVNLHRDPGPGEKPLHLSVHGQPMWEEGLEESATAPCWAVPSWEEVQRQVSVPVGKWLDLDMEYAQGDKESGRFVYGLCPEGGSRLEVFNIRDWTYNPRSESPAPLWGWNPMKLYTSEELVNYVRSHGGRTQLHWDDLVVSVSDSLLTTG